MLQAKFDSIAKTAYGDTVVNFNNFFSDKPELTPNEFLLPCCHCIKKQFKVNNNEFVYK